MFLLEEIIRVGKKGVTILPKKLRREAGIEEGCEVRVQVLPYGVLLRPRVDDAVGGLADLPVAKRKVPSSKSVRKIREEIDEELKGHR